MPCMRRALALIANAALLLAASSAVAERLPVRAYTTADGLARDEVSRIRRDSRGFLWIVTPEGLSRFDGHSFTECRPEPGREPAVVTDVLETRGGELIVATYDGPYRVEPDPVIGGGSDRLRLSPLIDGKRGILALHEDAEGTIWCGLFDGLARLRRDGDAWSFEDVALPWPDNASPERRVTVLANDEHGNLWIGSTLGLFRRTPDGRIDWIQLSRRSREHVRDILIDRDGRKWIALSDGLVRIGPAWPVVRPLEIGLERGLAETRLLSLLESADGTIWAGTAYGLGEMPPGASSFRFHTLADGLADDYVADLEEDIAGNIWIATESGGALRLARNGLTSFFEADGVGHARVAQLLEDGDGRLVAVDNFGHLSVFDGQRFAAITPKHGQPRDRMGWGWQQYVVRDRDGRWWIPSVDGLFRFPAVPRVEDLARTRPERIFTKEDGLGANEVFRLFEDSKGDVWIATFENADQVLTRWDRATGRLIPEPLEPLRPRAIPTAFCEDHAGNLWIGLYDGTLLRTRRGRDVEVILPGSPLGLIRAMFVDASGRLWIGADRGGLARIQDPTATSPAVQRMTTADGLSSDAVSCFVADDDGGIWIGTGVGIDRLDVSTGRIEHLGVSDGLANSFVNVAWRDRSGSLWFGTLRGLSRLVTRPDRRSPIPPTWITHVRVAGRAAPISGFGERDAEVIVHRGERPIEIGFTAPSFAVGANMRFQWRLDEVDATWTAPSSQRLVTYEHLVAGTHRLRVRATSSDGSLAGPTAQVAIVVEAAAWRRWWSLALFAVAAALLVRASHGWSVRRIVELERVRTRIASDLHDDIGAGLTQVAILSEVTRRRAEGAPPDVIRALDRIAVVSRELVDSMSDIVWAVDPRREALSDLVHRMRRFSSDVFTAKDIAFTFESRVADDAARLPADLRRQIYLVLKEAVNNAARHSGCSRATVRLERIASPPALLLVVEDDGVGFELDGDITGVGLGSLVTRARAMGGTLDLSSGEGKGTRVSLVVPLERTDWTRWTNWRQHD